MSLLATCAVAPKIPDTSFALSGTTITITFSNTLYNFRPSTYYFIKLNVINAGVNNSLQLTAVMNAVTLLADNVVGSGFSTCLANLYEFQTPSIANDLTITIQGSATLTGNLIVSLFEIVIV